MATYRHRTPPSRIEVNDHDAPQCQSGSASSRASRRTSDWSPATAQTAATTPPRSPQSCPFTDSATSGPFLHPHPRPQHLRADPAGLPNPHSTHARTTSLPGKSYHVQFGAVLPPKTAPQRRLVNPYHDGYTVPSPYEYMSIPVPVYGRPASSGTSSSSNSNAQPVYHARNPSSSSPSSSIDPSMLSRYGYPTYRTHPVGPRAPPVSYNHLAPISLSRSNIQSYPVAPRRSASPPVKPTRPVIRVEIPRREFEDDDDYDEDDEDDDEDDEIATSTVLDYLTSPNPIPSLIRRTPDVNKSLNTHFWFDIRNLRPWVDFNIQTITGFPGLLKLLKFDIPAERLPSPGKVSLHPDGPLQLAELCANHHAVKVNAALRVAQGERHMAMRALSSPPGGARQQPEFVANYHSDAEKTIFGDGRGRVVGVVKCYEQWHSGMRQGGANDKVRYLRHLAHLHRFMREHGTRYGFIITELEVVCVRAGGDPSLSPEESPNLPLFGFLELAAPVPIAYSSPAGSPVPAMTADLALWYLHMLAKEQPFPGQFHWRLEVGPPKARTRRHHEPRDEWMPKPNVSEKREAKRVRGWVWPDEPLSKREYARKRRGQP